MVGSVESFVMDNLQKLLDGSYLMVEEDVTPLNEDNNISRVQ
jgi:hypothetical protein